MKLVSLEKKDHNFACPGCGEKNDLAYNGRDEDRFGNKSGILNFVCGKCQTVFKSEFNGKVVWQI